MGPANGYVIEEGPRTIVIATGFHRKSSNPKTGPMVHLWMLPKAVNPVEAALTGQDQLVCGACKLRSNGCYVRLEQAPLAIYKAWQNGKYPRAVDLTALFAGRYVRFGAYGDPVLLSLKTVEQIVAVARGHTGFTHQWKRWEFQGYRKFFMASCEAPDYQMAIAMGWRAFVISRAKLPGLMVCPASAEFEAQRGWKLTCQQCLLCQGNGTKARSVQLAPHGIQARKIK